MLTVRHIEPTGHETITQTRRVTSEPGNQMTGGERVVFWENEEGGVFRIESGQVYVMNSAGKTVAVYDLSNAPQPIAA